MSERLSSTLRSATSFVGLLVVWWVLSATDVIDKAFLPSPAKVWAAFVEGLTQGTLLQHMGISMVRLLASYVGASILGVAVGVIMGLIPGVGRFLRPLLSFFSSMSGVTWLPLAIAWFGVSWVTITFVIFNSVFFIMAVTTLSGVQAVPKVYEQALRTLGGGHLRVINQVLLPGAMPSMITGLRLSLGFAWRALIAVEMVAGASGLGYMVFNASYNFHQDVMLMGILVTGVVAIIIDQVIFQPLERRTIERWGLV